MKYLVVKGWLGFGDRLESLKMCIHYAVTHNLKIYVDWTDEMWSHGEESFYKYFKLTNVPQIASLDEIPEDATYFPVWWKGNIRMPMSKELFGKCAEYSLNLDTLAGKSFSQDVVVLANVGRRTLYHDSIFFADKLRVVDEEVRSVVQQRMSQITPRTWGIHLRGTDRLRRDGRRSLSIMALNTSLVAHGSLNSPPMIVIGDDKESMDILKRFYPNMVSFASKSLEIKDMKGVHNVGKESLPHFSKDRLNKDALIDFFTLALCDPIFSTMKDSRFAQEARRFHPFVKNIL
jgi:hypothetical protein